MVLKGSYIAEYKSQSSCVQQERAEPRKAERWRWKWNPTNANTQLLLLDIVQDHRSLTVHINIPKQSICTPATFWRVTTNQGALDTYKDWQIILANS